MVAGDGSGPVLFFHFHTFHFEVFNTGTTILTVQTTTEVSLCAPWAFQPVKDTHNQFWWVELNVNVKHRAPSIKAWNTVIDWKYWTFEESRYKRELEEYIHIRGETCIYNLMFFIMLPHLPFK